MIIVLLILIALILADGYTTWRILRAGGREINQIMAWLIERMGLVPALVFSRGLAILAVTVLVYPNLLAMLVLCFIYGVVVGQNWYQMGRMR